MSQGKSDRQQRLAEALRANLRRRKGQAREWAEGEEPAVPAETGPPVPDDAGAHEAGRKD